MGPTKGSPQALPLGNHRTQAIRCGRRPQKRYIEGQGISYIIYRVMIYHTITYHIGIYHTVIYHAK